MKLLVKVTGPFMLVDPSTKCEVSPDRPSVVVSSNFIETRLAVGQLKVLSNELKEVATDVEFGKFWMEASGDSDLAVESFLSAFKPEPEAAVTSEPEVALEPKAPVKLGKKGGK